MITRVACLAIALASFCGPAENRPIVVGSKNFTESVILGELIAQKLESAGCRVDRRLNMGGTFVCDAAVRSGAIDVYVEYSGNALTAILKQPWYEPGTSLTDRSGNMVDTFRKRKIAGVLNAMA